MASDERTKTIIFTEAQALLLCRVVLAHRNRLMSLSAIARSGGHGETAAGLETMAAEAQALLEEITREA